MVPIVAGVAGILLTGGASRRMGFDKAMLEVGGVPNAVRLARLLEEVAAPAVEVGPGCSGLAHVRERPAGSGPLAALCAGADGLCRAGHRGPVLVLACDLPFIDAGTLKVLAGWPGRGSVVPRAGGRAQPLCARWSEADLEVARELVEAGERSMKALLVRSGPELVEETFWPSGVAVRLFSDLDTPEDLDQPEVRSIAGQVNCRRRFPS